MSIPSRLPGVPYGPPPRVAAVSGALGLPPKLVVIHDTSNTASAQAEASYAATRSDVMANWTSAHFYVDTTGVLGSAPLDVACWAAYSYANHNGWHIEMCGMNAGQPGAVPAATVAHAAQLVARLCDLAGIPKVKLSPAQVAAGARGICGHYDITIGLGVGDHDDPGPRFDWAGFMRLVQQGGDDMEQTDPLVHKTDNAPSRTVGDVLTDLGNLRDYLIGAGALVPGDPAYPRSGSLLSQLSQPGQVALTDAQVAALGAQLVTAHGARLDALEAKLDRLLAADIAAGRAASA